MFGNVQPDQGELKVKELALYRAHYCALCKSIGKNYSEAARLTLNYDCTFIALVLSGVMGGATYREMRCAYKPLKKPAKVAEPSAATDFAADLNIILAWHKLCDDIADEGFMRRTGALLGRTALYGDYKNASRRSGELCAAAERGMHSLNEAEKSGCGIDESAAAFADLMHGAAMCAPIGNVARKKAFAAMLAALGRWVYALDAWNDRNADKEKGTYNPFNISADGGADEASLKERAEIFLFNSIAEAERAYLLLRPLDGEAIVENILTEGCVKRTRHILGGGHD